MKTLRIAPELALPVDVAGEAIAILAKRGAGKTNTATVLVEELYDAGVQVVILDPVGAWWGIRSSHDGKQAGLPFAILGGQHGDVPLEHTAGALIADVVVENRESLLLDLSDFSSKAQMARFVVDFGERLFRAKARDRSLIHLVLEEADAFAPQKGSSDDARMRGAIEQIVRRGRSRGLGLTMVTQRSAVLNKDILSQADVLIAMRTTSPHDVAAIKLWISAHADDELGVVESLPSLETGDAWVWNPERGLLDRVRIRRRRTFDSSATPKAGEQRVEPKQSAPIDLAKLGAEIQATAERAKENDPTELRKRIRQLEETTKTQAERIREQQANPLVERVEVPILTDKQIERVEQIVAKLEHDMEAVENVATALRSVTEGLRIDVIEAARAETVDRKEAPRPAVATAPPVRPPSPPAPPRPDADHPPQLGGELELPLGAAKLLTVLAQFPAGRTRKQLGVLAGYKASGSSFRGAIAELRKRGYVSPASVEPIVATPEGLAVAPAEPLPTGRALYEHWRRELPESARKVLDVLYEAWPDGVDRDEIAARVGYEPTGSSMRGALAALRNVDLITPARVEPIKAADELMEEA